MINYFLIYKMNIFYIKFENYMCYFYENLILTGFDIS